MTTEDKGASQQNNRTEIEVVYRDAAYRYLNDAEFHARVYRGVIAAGQTGKDMDTDEARSLAIHVAAMTLHLSDLNFLPSENGPSRTAEKGESGAQDYCRLPDCGCSGDAHDM